MACGSTTRRLVAKALCRIFRKDITEAAGPRQFGVGKAAGTEKMQKILSVQTQRWNTAVVVSLDAANAFNSMARGSIRAQVLATVPSLARVCGWWYARATSHIYWDEAHRPSIIEAQEGVDQGCALSPGLFAIALAPVLHSLEGTLRTRDDTTRVHAYLDDVFIVCDAGEAEAAVASAAAAMGELNLALKLEKTQIWSPVAGVVLRTASGRQDDVSWGLIAIPASGASRRRGRRCRSFAHAIVGGGAS